MINPVYATAISGLFLSVVCFLAGRRQGRERALKVMKRAKGALIEFKVLFRKSSCYIGHGGCQRQLRWEDLKEFGFTSLVEIDDIIAEIKDLEKV